MKDKLQTTIEKEPDYLSLIKNEKGEKLILHLEFQTQDEKNMVYRMQEYYGILRKKYQLPVIQKVIFFGKSLSKMQTQLKPEEQFTGFELINFVQQSYELLFNSQVPEEYILSILADLHEDDPKKVIEAILEKLKETYQNKIMFQKYVQQLIVLSKLRNLSIQTKTAVKKMPIIYDIKQDAFYQEGVEDEKKRLEKERREEKTTIITNLLNSGKLTIEEISELTNTPLAEVKKTARNL